MNPKPSASTRLVVIYLLEFMQEHEIEIVSYGLAPNPWGFCYEAPEGTSKTVHNKMNDLLNNLTGPQEALLKREVFG